MLRRPLERNLSTQLRGDITTDLSWLRGAKDGERRANHTLATTTLIQGPAKPCMIHAPDLGIHHLVCCHSVKQCWGATNVEPTGRTYGEAVPAPLAALLPLQQPNWTGLVSIGGVRSSHAERQSAHLALPQWMVPFAVPPKLAPTSSPGLQGLHQTQHLGPPRPQRGVSPVWCLCARALRELPPWLRPTSTRGRWQPAPRDLRDNRSQVSLMVVRQRYPPDAETPGCGGR